jgi:hypothetical protein
MIRTKHLLAAALVCALSATVALARPPEWVIRDGKLWVDGQWVFLKIAKPLRNFADEGQVEQLIKDLDVLQLKHFNCIEINCYWHHFDRNGDGTPDVPTKALRKLVDAIYDRGMFPCISVETYGVGGGQVPEGFWKKNPRAVAIDSDGKAVKDDEYGVMSAVPSIFSPEYLKASRNFIRSIARAVDHKKVLYFETTVEPQYIGNHALDYTPPAKAAYERWMKENFIDGPAFPESLPAPDEFVNDVTWNRFRAQALADWINGDADAFRSVAGGDAYIAVDYLETGGPDMRNRNGDSLTFLTHLTNADIVQVNWHWNAARHAPNGVAYENVRQVMKSEGRDWAVTEHMTINGTDYAVSDMEGLLRNTIRNSTHFGWEFVSVGASKSPFSVYDPDWSPRPTMKVVDENWGRWMKEVRAAEEGATTAPAKAGAEGMMMGPK